MSYIFINVPISYTGISDQLVVLVAKAVEFSCSVRAEITCVAIRVQGWSNPKICSVNSQLISVVYLIFPMWLFQRQTVADLHKLSRQPSSVKKLLESVDELPTQNSISVFKMTNLSQQKPMPSFSNFRKTEI